MMDWRASTELAKALNLHPVTARWLVARGLSDVARVESFLHPKLADLRRPDGLAGLSEAVQRLSAAVKSGETVGVFGDYDVDGVSGAALISSFLGDLRVPTHVRVASREAGYGFGREDAEWFVARNCTLIIAVDCGTSDFETIRFCRTKSIDVVVVDHHQMASGGDAGGDHPAVALLNPQRADSTYPFRGFAAVGLGFFLVVALRTSLRKDGWFTAGRVEPDARLLLDLVALGTIADLAPLCEENRALVKAGLRELQARRRPGMAALLDVAGIEPGKQVDEIDIGWRLGPRLNAPGRMGDATPALELLCSRDLASANQRAIACEEANVRRRALQDEVFQQACSQAEGLDGVGVGVGADRSAVVVAADNWHPGVLGIVAAKLTERYRRPAAVISIDQSRGRGRGSVRSIEGLHVFRALSSCREHLVGYGGHARAGGFTVDAAKMDDFRCALKKALALPAGDATTGVSLEIDTAVALDEVDVVLTTELRSLAPFGEGNQEPLLVAPGAVVRQTWRVGQEGGHLKMLLECPRSGAVRSAIGFNMGSRSPGVGSQIDVAFVPEVSVWQGQTRVELRVRDLRPAQT
ncbi:MAG: single-stranded-DNA-specific exonuclease RecJ [Pseudomonadota bacterium]